MGPRVSEHVREDVPMCRLDERMVDVRERVRPTGWDTCIVINEHRVVLGRVGRQALASGDDVSVEEAMTSGPGTVRPSATLEAIAERLRERNLTSALVTRSDGTLVGLLLRQDAE